MSNPSLNPRFDALVEAHFEVGLSEAETAELERELLGCAQKRARFWELAEVHALIRDTQPIENITPFSLLGTIPPLLGASWRAAAVLLLGAFLGLSGAGTVWAFTQSARTDGFRPVLLEEGSSGPRGGALPTGISASNAWGGDPAQWAPKEFPEGTIRFLQAAGEGGETQPTSCDLYRIVDLRALRSEGKSAPSALELAAEFLDQRAQAEDLVRFTVRIRLYAGDPEAFAKRWPDPGEEPVSLGSELLRSYGGSPGAWKRIVAWTSIPKEATFALLQVVATRAPRGAAAAFGEQYVRDIRVRVQRQPVP